MNIKQAQQAGVEAFNEGRKMAPALNNAFISAACASETDTCALLDAYTHGWTIANLSSAAIPGAPSTARLAEIMS